MKNISVLCYFSLLLSLFSENVIAQRDESKLSTKKKIKVAKEYFRVEEYHHSFDLFGELLKKDPDNPEYNYYFGVSLLHMEEQHKGDALQPLLKVEESGKYFSKLYFYLGRAYHLNHDFDQAIAFYKKHLQKEIKFDEDSNPDVINYLVKQCENGKRMVANPVNVEIYNLGDNINTEAPEIAPVVSADETRLIFTSRRKDSMGGEIDPIMGLPYEDIYIVEKDENGQWGVPKNIGAPINTNRHDASIGLSPDGQELFIYKDEFSATSLVTGSIYKSVMQNGKWSVPEKLQEGINIANTRETHATITPDEKVMIFTSSRNEEGAQGGLDLYMVRRLPNLQWAKPVNLGSTINTPYDEESPFLHPNGKILYFSSKGHDSMGGYDIFYSEWDEKTEQWSKPKNVGYPINTADDDLFYSVSADGMRGYFSSIRPDSRGGHDLYVADVPSRDLKIIALKGKVFDKETQQPLAATIVAVNNETGMFVSLANSNNTNGRFSLFLEPNKNYGIRVIKEGYLFKSLNINVSNQFEYLDLEEVFYLQKNGTEKLEVLNNIFFSEETADLMITSEPELEALKDWLKDHPEYMVEIAVHTDNTQDSLVALYTTQAKADAIVEELKKIGADGRRIVGKGYGFGYNYPIATNLTTMGRLKNNRIEYIVRANRNDLEDIVYEEINEVFKDPDVFKSFQCPNLGETLKLSHKIDIHPIDNTLNANAIKALDEVATILDRCNDIVVEIGGHTDNKGHESYNLERSEKKAQLIKQQLVYRGIAAHRLTTVGYGSSKPLVDNTTEEGREMNNRVEIKVIKGGGKVIAATFSQNNTFAESGKVPRENKSETDGIASVASPMARGFVKSTSAKKNTDSITTVAASNTNQSSDKSSNSPTSEVAVSYQNRVSASELDVSKMTSPQRLAEIIHFDFNSHQIDEKSKKVLEKIEKLVKNSPDKIQIIIEGHTDSIGSDEYNQKLGERRARMVKQYLKQKGFKEGIFMIKSLGESQPIESNDTKEGRNKNRRVEFVVMKLN